eukprot:6228674-Lingulodinium_polyedra.AAC.1
MPLKVARVVTHDEMDSSGATLVAGSIPEATIPPPPPVETLVAGVGGGRCLRWRRKWLASR